MTMPMHRKDTHNEDISLETLLKLKKHERPGDDFWEAFDQQLHQRTLQTLIGRQTGLGRLRAFFSVRFHPAMPAAVAAIVVMALAVPGTINTMATNHPGATQEQESIQVSEQALATAEVPEQVSSPLQSTGSTHYVVDRMEGSHKNGQHYTVAASNRLLSSSNVKYISGKLMSAEFGVSRSTPIAAVY